jgi:hypothetical protein
MTTEQREKLREVLIDYLQLLTALPVPHAMDTRIHDSRIAEVRLLLREVA